ncbi:hypothetical protein J6590_004872 [Homalodisca vitripennis]|nr:hypothetical protein J6590_004872 [Homalodisca vitripennis]
MNLTRYDLEVTNSTSFAMNRKKPNYREGKVNTCKSGVTSRTNTVPLTPLPATSDCYRSNPTVALLCGLGSGCNCCNFTSVLSADNVNWDSILVWFCLDYLADFLYLVDIMFHFRTGYLEDGVLQTDSTKLRHHYMNSTTFYIDCLCLLPLDFLYLSIGFNSILRSFRLVKIYRFWAFMDRTERHTNYPNLFRSTSLIHYLLVIFHWNGCLFHIICKNKGFGSKNWVYGDTEPTDVVEQYLQSYYWCTLALTTIGDLPRPRSKGEYLFVILQLLFGLLLFATVLGHVANIVTSVSAARKEFQALTWALMELFWTNEKAAMAARPRPLPPSPPPSHTPRPLLDPLRRPPSQWESSKPPTLRERWRTSDGGRAMADGVMADEQKFVSPAAGIRTRAPTNARLSR